ncbi:hypothetical protein H6503_02870 [Candidatus Woesearchaeota archaeon]|nr:hypothetical protein [Candidatus Woesearchaeota archaeon]
MVNEKKADAHVGTCYLLSKRAENRVSTWSLLSKKGEMGMGTLIIFIAMILVAAVAAGVLISTTGTLQNKALSTGKATSAEVGTSMNVVKLYAEDGTDQQLEEFTGILKLNAGSEPIRFSDVLLTVNLINTSADYTYDSAIQCSNGTTWNSSNTTAGGDFGVEYSINGTNHQDGYLTKGDVAKICFESPRNISESENVVFTFVPKVGSVRLIEADMPDLMVDKRVDVYP